MQLRSRPRAGWDEEDIGRDILEFQLKNTAAKSLDVAVIAKCSQHSRDQKKTRRDAVVTQGITERWWVIKKSEWIDIAAPKGNSHPEDEHGQEQHQEAIDECESDGEHDDDQKDQRRHHQTNQVPQQQIVFGADHQEPCVLIAEHRIVDQLADPIKDNWRFEEHRHGAEEDHIWSWHRDIEDRGWVPG